MIWHDLRFPTAAGEFEKIEQPEAGVSLDRFHNEIPACARRFVKMVVTPYAAVYSQIVDKVKAAADSYVERDQVVSDLCREFNGRIGQHNRGQSVTVYFPGNLPPVTVSAGGFLRLEHPSFNGRTLRAYFNAILETNESA